VRQVNPGVGPYTGPYSTLRQLRLSPERSTVTVIHVACWQQGSMKMTAGLRHRNFRVPERDVGTSRSTSLTMLFQTSWHIMIVLVTGQHESGSSGLTTSER